MLNQGTSRHPSVRPHTRRTQGQPHTDGMQWSQRMGPDLRLRPCKGLAQSQLQHRQGGVQLQGHPSAQRHRGASGLIFPSPGMQECPVSGQAWATPASAPQHRAVSACLPTASQGPQKRRKEPPEERRAEEEEGAEGWAAAASPRAPGQPGVQAHRPRLTQMFWLLADREV